MTVARLEAEMPNAEFMRWQVYLGRRAQREQLETQKAQNAAKRTKTRR